MSNDNYVNVPQKTVVVPNYKEVFHKIKDRSGDSRNFKKPFLNKVSRVIEGGAVAGSALGLAGLLSYMIGKNSDYKEVLRKLDNVWDGAGDVVGVGERAKRDNEIQKTLDVAVELAYKHSKELLKIVTNEEIDAYLLTLPENQRKPVKKSIETIAKDLPEYEKQSAEIMKEHELLVANMGDYRFKLQRLADETESILASCSNWMRNGFEKLGLDWLLNIVESVDPRLRGRGAIIRQQRSEYLKSADQLYQTLDRLKGQLEVVAKKYGIDEGQLGTNIDDCKNYAELLRNGVPLNDEQKKDFDNKLNLVCKYMDASMESGKKVLELAKKVNNTYENAKELQQAKGTVYQSFVAKKALNSANENKIYLGKNEPEIEKIQSDNKIKTIQQDYFGFKSEFGPSSIIVGGYLIAAAVTCLAASRVASWIRTRDYSAKYAKENLKEITSIVEEAIKGEENADKKLQDV